MTSPFHVPTYCLPEPEDCNAGAGPAATTFGQITRVVERLPSIVQIEFEALCNPVPRVQVRPDQFAEQNLGFTANLLWHNQPFQTLLLICLLRG
jgi:hypothetical protein